MNVRKLTAIALLLVPCTPALADTRPLEAGGRLLVLLGDGVPANDMVGFGMFGRWELRPGWHLGAAIDQVEFDYERPNDILGIPSAAEIDGSNDWTRVSAWLERRYDATDLGWSGFWLAGIGYAALSTEIVTGLTPSGTPWEIETDASDELHALAGAGIRRYFGERLVVETALHLEHHSTDYGVRDRVSGATGSVGSQTPWGLSAGVSYRF